MQDLPKGADRQWIMKAKKYIQEAQEKVSEEKEFLKELLTTLEGAISEHTEDEFTDEEAGNI